MFLKINFFSDLNGDKSELKILINSRIEKISELKKVFNNETDSLVLGALISNVNYLSGYLYNSGFIVDPLEGKKYFLTDTTLPGGGAGYAKYVTNFKDYPLYDEKGNMNVVTKSINYFVHARMANTQSRVFIVIFQIN